MKIRKNVMCLIIAVSLLALIPSLQALSDDNSFNVIYQTSFSSDPRWTTNNPATNYWDPNQDMYHFSIEPSTGGYAYTVIDYERGSFTFDYDLILTKVDEGATFRFGLSGSEMDPSKNPNVLSMFTNEKYGQIMWLHLVTPGSKLMEVNSQHAAVEMGPTAYNGPTVKYELNKTYHVTIKYEDDRKIISMTVSEKLTGKEIWSYYLNTAENLNGMNRIFLGSKGDYGRMNIYALGYIDNVRLTTPAEVTTTPSEVTQATTFTTTPTKKPTPKQTIIVPTPYPTDTPASPSAGILAIEALGIVGVVYGVLGRMKKN
ncbi:MAG TPA: hypothetical protein VMW77_02780 [Methanoregula sp.]|nr:hypothetical protein [Methanoregula sp.]